MLKSKIPADIVNISSTAISLFSVILFVLSFIKPSGV